MASPNPPPAPLDPAFAAAFAREAGPARVLRFDAFMALALYDPTLGYYRRDRKRVGRDRAADFYTATSLGPLFGELVAAACAKLLRDAGLDPAAHTFLEIGAEPSGGVLAGVPTHPFAAARTLRVGESLVVQGPCVVFSNELFDAQPIRRFVRRASAWHELGVGLSPDGLALAEHDLGPAPDDARSFLPPFAATPEGYVFDAPRAAAELATLLAVQEWQGLFVAFDYGKSFAELGHSVPAGTARAYHQHAQHNDLLARPGEQDLTAHVCWDWLRDALASHGCATSTVESQESFFVHHAGDFIAEQLARETSPVSPRKRALLHLLHPGQMGQKFQVLHACKFPTRAS
ncbi:MAG: SAM-dependent methyltransferase [Opitutaceae bacterium]|jgi:SAM-dependent MidA family methyltransferase|nr:SAM-dependent methyltransferase [Opitutaceae bacterium]